MIKKLGLLVLLVLALNFLAVAGGAGYLIGTGKLDKEKGTQIAKILFPDPVPTSQPTTQPIEPDLNDPLVNIDELLVKTVGMSAAEQNQFIRSTFDAVSAQLDRQRRELIDLKRQVDFAQTQLARDRTAVDEREKALATRITERTEAEKEEGFQQSLAVYDAMKAKQVKDVFMNLEIDTVVRYLQAMDPRRVSAIIKEFKTPVELDRAQTLLEMMRKNGVTQDAANTSSTQ